MIHFKGVTLRCWDCMLNGEYYNNSNIYNTPILKQTCLTHNFTARWRTGNFGQKIVECSEPDDACAKMTFGKLSSCSTNIIKFIIV